MPALTDIIIVDIPVCPRTGLNRKVRYTTLSHHVDEKKLDIVGEVSYYDSEGVKVVTPGIQPYKVKMIADNDVRVNGEGVIIDDFDDRHISTIEVVSGGTGYTLATVKVNGEEVAGYTVTIVDGVITAIEFNEEDVFKNAPIITIEGDGADAEVNAILGDLIITTFGQYDFVVAALANGSATPFELIAFAIIQGGNRGRYDVI